jgi:hypothetical protein
MTMRFREWLCAGALLMALPLGACGGGGDEADAAPGQPDAPPAKGTFSLTWTLTDTMGAAITCDTVKAAQVTITLVPSAGGPGSSESFNCQTGMGTSSPVVATTYDMTIELKNSSGQVMAMAVAQNDVVITANQDTALMPATFSVSRTGGLKFKLDVPGTSGTNCDDEMGNPAGAGVEGVRITLTRGGVCVPATFDVPAGGMGEPAQTITAACPGGGTGTCIELDQEVTATGLEAGDYVITVVGTEGPTDCYSGTGNTAVSGGDTVKSAGTIQIALDSMNMSCAGP